MGRLSLIDRVRITLGGWAFLLAGRLWPETFDVWLDDAPRKTHLPGDDQYPSALPVPALDALRDAAYDVIDITADRTGWEDANAMRDRILRILRAALRKGETP